MPSLVALDAGPLVALFNPDDAVHKRAVAFVGKSRRSFITTLPVVTEVMYLLAFNSQNQVRFIEWLRRGGVGIIDLDDGAWIRIAELCVKYADLRPDFADLSLVAACESCKTRLVASIDKDFQIYRYQGRQAFENVFRN